MCAERSDLLGSLKNEPLHVHRSFRALKNSNLHTAKIPTPIRSDNDINININNQLTILNTLSRSTINSLYFTPLHSRPQRLPQEEIRPRLHRGSRPRHPEPGARQGGRPAGGRPHRRQAGAPPGPQARHQDPQAVRPHNHFSFTQQLYIEIIRILILRRKNTVLIRERL